MYFITAIILTVILWSTNYGTVNGSTVADDRDDLVLTAQAKRSLDEFKSQVEAFLPEKFMKSDFYLVQWLRTANMNVPAARRLLLNNVNWRKHENISQILTEDFSDMLSDYHMTFGNLRDKIGRPVMTADLGDWDLRGAILQGRQKRLQRYLTYSLEKGMISLFEAQQTALKKNVVVTQAITLIDADGGNLLQHLCPRCLLIFMQWLQEMELYYPRIVREVIIVNAPSVAAIGINAVKPILSQASQRALKIFDSNKSVWMQYLDERIDRSQRPTRYGGTRADDR